MTGSDERPEDAATEPAVDPAGSDDMTVERDVTVSEVDMDGDGEPDGHRVTTTEVTELDVDGDDFPNGKPNAVTLFPSESQKGD